ncbi:SDR family oxidoreductase [Nocardia macrotermitis]
MVAETTRPTALITGASRGLGAAIARELAATHHLLLGARTPEALAGITAELSGITAGRSVNGGDLLESDVDHSEGGVGRSGSATNRFVGSGDRSGLGAERSRFEGGGDLSGCGELPGFTPWPVELTDYEAVAAACAPIERLDVLVHNAGVADLGTIAESSVAQWRNTLEANVIAVSELTRLLLPALRAAKGHVVLINSGAGLRANPGWGVYAASKFALRAFGDALRLEEPELRVTSIHPGRIDTDMQRAIVAGEGHDYHPEQFLTAPTVARTVRTAIETPRDAHPTEIVLRPIARDAV